MSILTVSSKMGATGRHLAYAGLSLVLLDASGVSVLMTDIRSVFGFLVSNFLE